MQDFFLGRGRTGRLNYFLMLCGTWVVAVMFMTMSTSINQATGEASIGIFGWVVYAIAFWATMALGIRRAHDINRRGWYVLLTFIPLVGLIIGLQLLFEPGTHGPNRHGIAAGVGTHKPESYDEMKPEKVYASADISNGPSPDYYNDDGSFNMNGLFDSTTNK